MWKTWKIFLVFSDRSLKFVSFSQKKTIWFSLRKLLWKPRGNIQTLEPDWLGLNPGSLTYYLWHLGQIKTLNPQELTLFLSTLGLAERPPQEGWREGPFHPQWRNDQSVRHRHSQAHSWGGFQEACPSGTYRDRKFVLKEMGTPDVLTDIRLNKALWAKGRTRV